MTAGTEGLAAWPPAAVATVVAAVGAASVALVGALVGGVWAVLRWRRDVAREERDRYWSRLTTVFDFVTSADTGRREIGGTLARAMYDMRRVPPGEEPGARVLAELLADDRRTM